MKFINFFKMLGDDIFSVLMLKKLAKRQMTENVINIPPFQFAHGMLRTSANP